MILCFPNYREAIKWIIRFTMYVVEFDCGLVMIDLTK
jgi:hypothetical protein